MSNKNGLSYFVCSFLLLVVYISGNCFGRSLIGHWDFGESDGKAVIDRSGNGIDGVIHGNVKFTDGDYGRAMVFDGSVYIDFGSHKSMNTGEAMTIEMWIKPYRFPRGQYRMIIGNSDADYAGWQLYHAGWDNNIWLYGERRNPPQPLLRNYLRTGYIMGGWRYLVVTYDGNNIRFFVDGKQRSIRSGVGGFAASEGNLRIGITGKDQRPGDFFEGEIAEIKIYDFALDSTSINRNSRAPIRMGVKVMGVPKSMDFELEDKTDDRSKEEWIATNRAIGWPIAPEITAEEANEVCRNIRAKGFDTVFLSGRYRYMFAEDWGQRNWWNAVPWDQYLKTTSLFSKACKDHGLRLVMHLTSNLALYPDYERLFKGMETRFVDTDEPGEWPRYFGYALCPNNPDFQQMYLGRLKEMMRIVKPDGMMIDETGFSPTEVPGGRTCGCQHCRSQFTEQYGFEIPSDTSDVNVWKNWDNEQWRAWQKFRTESVGRWAGKRKAAIDEVIGETLFTACSSCPLQAFTAQLAGGDGETFMQHGTIFFYESQPATPWSWRKVVAEGKYIDALGPVILFVNTASVSQAYWTHILGMAHGWCNHQWPEFNQWRVLPVVWQEKWQNIWLGNESIANVAVIYSSPTRTLSGKYVEPENDMTEYLGWAQALTEMHIPFDVVTALQLTPEKLSRYDLVILPDTFCLSQSQNDVLRNFVKNGGNMIATDESSVYDYEGRRGDNFALADVFGVELTGNQRAAKLGDLTGPAGERYPFAAGGYCIVEAADAQTMFKRASDDKPIVTVNEYGKGKCAYAALQLGTGWYMPQVGVGWYGEAGYWSDNREKSSKRIIEKLVGDLLTAPVKTENVPDEVIVNVVRHNTRGYSGTIIHLVNALGTKFEEYALVPPETDFEFVDYPPLGDYLPEGEKMKFNLKAHNVRAAYFISPDFKGAVRLNVRKIDKMNVEVELANLYRYGIIYLVQSDKDLIKETSNKILTEIPAAENFEIAYTSER